MRLEAWHKTHVGLIRKANQDFVGFFPELRLFVVADGMGGGEAGEVASRMAVETLRDFIAAAPPSSDGAGGHQTRAASSVEGVGRESLDVSGDELFRTLARRLSQGIELANRRIFDVGRQRSGDRESFMGTTIVAMACVTARDAVVWAHVGDSRLYLFRGGQLALLTADHTVYGEAFRDGVEIPTDLPHTSRLIRALGIRSDVLVSTGQSNVEAGDVFLLCSDGLSGMVDAEQIRSELRIYRTPPETLDALIQRALEAGGRDNASALLVRWIES
jgi:serine/threonine protein phosphatase PrpC